MLSIRMYLNQTAYVFSICMHYANRMHFFKFSINIFLPDCFISFGIHGFKLKYVFYLLVCNMNISYRVEKILMLRNMNRNSEID